LGAWAGGVAFSRGPGLPALGWVAALITLAGLGLALWSRAHDRRQVLQRPRAVAA
jgi:DHA1 family inner membrane transport protein